MKHPWDRPLGVWNVAELHPDALAIAECPEGETLTFAELAGRAHQVVHAGRAAGLGYGDTVALTLPNSLEMIVWMLAASEVGWRFLTLNTMSSAAEVTAIVEHSGAKALVVAAEYADRAGAVTSPPVLVSVGGELPGYRPLSDLLAGHPTTTPDGRRTGVMVTYTSGTMGKPKAIGRPMPEGDPTVAADRTTLFAHAFRYLPLTGAHLVSADMFHGGCQGFFLAALHVGQALVVMRRFDPEQALRLIEKHRVTTAYMVPTQFVRFLRLPAETRTRHDLSSLSSVVHSAAPCPADVKKQMFDWWGPVVWETYGGTEGAATIAKPHHWLARPGTVGRPVRGVKVTVLDDDGTQLPPGQVGTIYIDFGARRFTYEGDPDQTEQVYRGSAFTLGDLGYLDDDGFLYAVDRVKDMIITGGANVYPAEVEAALLNHPAVADVAVLGAPDPNGANRSAPSSNPSTASPPPTTSPPN